MTMDKYGPKKMPGEGGKNLLAKRPEEKKLPRKVEDFLNTERAVDKNAAMVGKARRESLLEKRKAKKSSKPTGPIVI